MKRTSPERRAREIVNVGILRTIVEALRREELPQKVSLAVEALAAALEEELTVIALEDLSLTPLFREPVHELTYEPEP